MRKLNHLFVLASAVLMLTACGNKGSQQGTETPATTNEAEAALPEAGRGDLGGFDLRGPVKECVWGESTYVFNEKGQLLSRDGDDLDLMYPGGVTRNDDGRLSECNADAYGSCYYTYNEQGLPTAIAEDGFYREFTYDDDGYVATEKHIISPDMGDEEAEPEEETFTFTIVEKDKVGNWTTRKDQNGNTQTRTITYYE